MKNYVAIIMFLLLSACAVPVQKDDEMDDTVQGQEMMDDESDGMMKKSEGGMMEDSESSDAGTVNGKTTEDAGGDGTTGMTVPRVIAVTADTWEFSPATIMAKRGEKVTLQITAVNGTHGFSVPDLGINAAVAAGQTVTVTLPTDKAGTFGGKCSIPCGSGHKDMHVTVVISE